MKEQLGITLLDPFRRIVEEEEPFEVLGKARYRLKDRALQGCVESVLIRAQARGELPYGLFGSLASRQVRSEVHERQERLKKYQVESDPLTLTLHPECPVPIYDENGWQLPSHTLLHPEAGPLTITGSLDAFSSKGFLTHGTGAVEERAVSLPLYLIFLLLRPQLEKLLKCTIEPACLFFGKEQRFTAPFSTAACMETALLHFIRYAEKARMQCAPLHKDWLAPMLKGDCASAAQIMESSLDSPQSAWRYRHILWARKQRADKNVLPWLQEWVEPLQQAYAPILG